MAKWHIPRVAPEGHVDATLEDPSSLPESTTASGTNVSHDSHDTDHYITISQSQEEPRMLIYYTGNYLLFKIRFHMECFLILTS